MGFMGSAFNETEIQIEFETSLRGGAISYDPNMLIRLKEKILAEMGRRRMSKNQSATEINISVATFNKVLRGERNISKETISKIVAWLTQSSEKPFRNKK